MSDSKVAVIAGYGVGISAAVAKRLAREGFNLALLARTQSRLDEGAAELAKQGVTAKGYATDLSNPAAVKETLAAVHNDLGPISLLHWNAYYGGFTSASLSATPTEDFVNAFNVLVTGLVAAVQAAEPDLKATKGTILVTGGGLSREEDKHTQMAVDYNFISLAVTKAAQRKLVHVLHKALEQDGVYVAEVTVSGLVKGTAFDPQGTSGLTPEAIAEKFWNLAEKRDPAVWFELIEQKS